jgi:Flp pilus assembly protein TadD
VALLEAAVVAEPRSATLQLAQAAALDAAGEPGRATAELRSLLALQPDQPVALARLAVLLVAGGADRLDGEADALAHRAADLAPRSPEALAALGRVSSLRGDHAGAIAGLERAVLLSGGEARFLDGLGDAYQAAGRPRDAAAAWRRALASAADEVPPVAQRLRAALRKKLDGAGRNAAAR